MKIFLNCNKPMMFKGNQAQTQPIEAKKPEVAGEAQPKLKPQPTKDVVVISAPSADSKAKKAEVKTDAKAEPKAEAKKVEVKTDAKAEPKAEAKTDAKAEVKPAKCEGEACKK